MPRLHRAALRSVLPPVCAALLFFAGSVKAQAQDTPPAYLSVVEGAVTLEREGEREPAVRDMPFVPGDRLRTENGRAEIQFPDGTAIEIGEDSLVEAVTPSRVRLLAGTMDHVQGRTAATSAAMSAAYLPAELQTYGDTFDRDGSWQYAEPHGYVWYPKVAPDWRPYHYGSWSAVPSYGWTWIGIEHWSWPTHHYGRWGYARNSWFWIPGRTWGAHQSSVASRQSSVASRQSSVASRQSSVRPLPWPSFGSARPATGDRGPTTDDRPATDDRRLATDDRGLATDDWRLTTPRAATPRAATPRAATPRQRMSPPPSARPRNPAPAPAQHAPAAPPAAASAPAPAPDAAPPARPTPHGRSTPAGATREGTARRQ